MKVEIKSFKTLPDGSVEIKEEKSIEVENVNRKKKVVKTQKNTGCVPIRLCGNPNF